jgi:Ca2+-binding RTX toxin-like protein
MTTIISPTPFLQVNNAFGGKDIVAQFDVPGFIKLDGDGKDTIIGGKETDSIYSGGGNDTIISGSGDDLVYGEAGSDIINAGAGDDVIVGGSGADTMTGGTGSDTFSISAGDLDGSLDIIKDFTLEEDSIRFEGIGSSAQVAYDANTGIISINGQDVLKVDEGLGIGSDDIKNSGSDWEIF